MSQFFLHVHVILKTSLHSDKYSDWNQLQLFITIFTFKDLTINHDSNRWIEYKYFLNNHFLYAYKHLFILYINYSEWVKYNETESK